MNNNFSLPVVEKILLLGKNQNLQIDFFEKTDKSGIFLLKGGKSKTLFYIPNYQIRTEQIITALKKANEIDSRLAIVIPTGLRNILDLDDCASDLENLGIYPEQYLKFITVR